MGKNLPCNGLKEYSKIIQGLIYHLLDSSFAKRLHEKGYAFEKRTFKHFTFSQILEKGKFDKNKEIFIFPNEISFILSSPIDNILEQVAKNSFMKNISMGSNRLSLFSVEVLDKNIVTQNKIRINTLSPIEVHSTLITADNRKKTYYYSPTEREFSELIQANIHKKWESLFKEECEYSLKIYPVDSRRIRQVVRSYKDFVIKGSKGHFYLEGDPKILRFALDVGLGSRNSQGFGCIELVKPKNRDLRFIQSQNLTLINPKNKINKEVEC